MPTLKKSKIEAHYAKILWGFIALTAIVIVLVVYFSFSKTVITLTPVLETILLDFSLPVHSAVSSDEAATSPVEPQTGIAGVLLNTTVRGEKTSVDLTETNEFSEKAAGTATIINNYSKSQPLVATTRLLSDSGVLYRTTETITVPAGEEVEVGIQADKEGADQAIGPSHFTIVALWPGIQDKIYGVSSAPTSQTGKNITIASAEDIRNVQDSLLAELIDQATATLRREASLTYPHLDFLDEVTDVNIISEFVDVEPDTEAGSITAETELRLTVLVADRARLEDRALEMLQVSLPEHKKLVPASAPELDMRLEDIDFDTQTAALSGSVTNSMVIMLSHPSLQPKHILGMSAQSIRTYFTRFPEIAEADIHFSPFWVRKAPNLEDHIEIVLDVPVAARQ